MTDMLAEPQAAPKFDPDAFARNLAQAMETGSQALATMMKSQNGAVPPDGHPPAGLTEMVKSFSTVANYWLSDQARSNELQQRLGKSYLELWGAASKRLAGEQAEPAIAPSPRDKRFASPEWKANACLISCCGRTARSIYWRGRNARAAVSERSDARRPERRAAGVVRHEQVGRRKHRAGALGDELHRHRSDRREADRGADAAEPQRTLGWMFGERRRRWRRIGRDAVAGFDGRGLVGVGAGVMIVLYMLRRFDRGRRQYDGRRRADRQSCQRQRHHQCQDRPEQSHPAFSSSWAVGHPIARRQR